MTEREKPSDQALSFQVGFGDTSVAKQPVAEHAAAASEGKQSSAPSPNEAAERAPFRIVVLSELHPRASYAKAPAPPLQLTRVHRFNFDEVMATYAPDFVLSLPSPLTEQPLEVHLRWEKLKALRPASIVAQVPELQALASAYEQLSSPAVQRQSSEAIRTQLSRLLPDGHFKDKLLRQLASAESSAQQAHSGSQPAPRAAAPEAASAPSSGLDALFAQVDLPAEAEASSGGSLLSAVLGSNNRKDTHGPAAAAVSEQLAQAFSQLLGDILSHPEVQRLESSWRGLWFLLQKFEPNQAVELDILSFPEGNDEVSRALVHLIETDDPSERARSAVDLLVLDRELGSSTFDLKACEAWASLAETLRAPLLLGAKSELVGAAQLSDLSYSSRYFAGASDPQSLGTQRLACRPEARWLCLCLNRVLARPAYTAESSRTSPIPFSQHSASSGAHTFIGAYWLVAALTAQSFQRSGHATEIVGPHAGSLKQLELHEVSDRGDTIAIPTEIYISSDTQAELASAGIVALSCLKNRDQAFISHAPMLYREPSSGGGDPAKASLTLADQLFISRFSQLVELLAHSIPASTPNNIVEEVAQITLGEFFQESPLGRPEVEARAREGLLEVQVWPRRFAGISISEIQLAARLGS